MENEQKNEPKKVVAKGKIKKKGLREKFAETFIMDDIHSVGEYILYDVAIPAFKKMIQEAGRDFLDRMFWGNGQRSSRSSSDRRESTSWERYYRDDRRESRRASESRSRRRDIMDEIVFNSRDEANDVLINLCEDLSRYKVVSVRTYYDYAGMQSTWTQDKWGWDDLRDVRPVRVSDGWILDLPRPITID